MKTIVVASLNPVKVEAILNGFQRLFPDERFLTQPVSVLSGVSDQPMTDRDTKHGALNRAEHARQAHPEGNYWVGVEGGCDYLDGKMVAFAWIVILSDDRCGSGRTAQFQLPDEVGRLVESGMELGEADDRLFGRENSKQKSGAVGILTNDVITRTSLYEQAVLLALIPFKNPSLY